ncbi:hypothetical protein MATL_G00127150 [Megalops atlanticus]|uniref:Ig-like domain-containing protein n=1 Tax=Megalops atlanticus TaxID=7932 RepID=A0A9D3PZF5_MEGAT|nr:hypothetical protein MATL_G00127150 [Megalops atlanticus]
MELSRCDLLFVFNCCVSLFTVGKSQQVSVDPEITAYIGGDATLRCQFIQGKNETQLIQGEWTREPLVQLSEKPVVEKIVVFKKGEETNYPESRLKGRVDLINTSVHDASIKIINVNKTDEGRYTCTYSTFPSGSIEGTTTLITEVSNPRLPLVPVVVLAILLVIILIGAAAYFIMRKRRSRPKINAIVHRRNPNQPSRTTEIEGEDVTYADVRHVTPASRGAALPSSNTGSEYAEVRHGSQSGSPLQRTDPVLYSQNVTALREEGGDTTYAQVKRN